MTEKQKRTHSYFKRFIKQLIASGLIFALFMIPSTVNSPSLKEFQQKAKEILFYKIDYQDIANTLREVIGKIVTSSGDTHNEDSTQTYPDA